MLLELRALLDDVLLPHLQKLALDVVKEGAHGDLLNPRSPGFLGLTCGRLSLMLMIMLVLGCGEVHFLLLVSQLAILIDYHMSEDLKGSLDGIAPGQSCLSVEVKEGL